MKEHEINKMKPNFSPCKLTDTLNSETKPVLMAQRAVSVVYWHVLSEVIGNLVRT